MVSRKSIFILPFEGSWLTSWGGDTKELNIHNDIAAQKYAYDFVITNETGKTFKNKGRANEDYHCFGMNVLAPANGEVVEAVKGVRDNIPGDTNPYMKTGNYILIKHAENEYSFLAHLKLNSLILNIGEKVKKGQKIGECGNSGNSSEPHLHYHVQNSFIFNRFDKDWKPVDIARGIKVGFSMINLGNDTAHLILSSISLSHL
jgi:murein DD-endopeptidase MepM/ murein hydrolase activator NlpD